MTEENDLSGLKIGDSIDDICEKCKTLGITENQKLELKINDPGSDDDSIVYYVFHCKNKHETIKERENTYNEVQDCAEQAYDSKNF